MTVVPQGALSFLSVWPQGQPYPGVSTLNSTGGVTLANAAIVPAGTVSGSGGRDSPVLCWKPDRPDSRHRRVLCALEAAARISSANV